MLRRRRSTVAWPLTWAYLALVAYASLYPFGPWRDQGLSTWSFLTAPWPQYWGAFDVWANVLGYGPLGFLAALSATRMGLRHQAWWLASGGAAVVSLLMEGLQSYLPVRVPSVADFGLNTLGGLLGALLANGLERLITHLDVLDPLNGPVHVANDILGMPADKTLAQWQERHALTQGFWLNNFCKQAFLEALQAPEEVRSTLGYVKRMCEWATHDMGKPTQRLRYPLCRDEFAYSLLSPWFERNPPHDIKNALLSELLRTLGDPRHNHAGWLGVRRQAIETASRWLTSRSPSSTNP
jgi:VanZ family protein